jgi:hypothetical protein
MLKCSKGRNLAALVRADGSLVGGSIDDALWTNPFRQGINIFWDDTLGLCK